jgi:hypothetical protein
MKKFKCVLLDERCLMSPCGFLCTNLRDAAAIFLIIHHAGPLRNVEHDDESQRSCGQIVKYHANTHNFCF